MNLTKQVGLVVGAAALALTGGSFADTTPEANTDLKAKLDSALARIDQLEAKQNDNWLTEQRAGEIRELVQDVLADADTRASLLAQGVTAGYDNGAVISSADGNWSLRTNIHMQQRFVWNDQDEGAVAGAIDEDRYGFENTRTKFILTGNVVNQDWIYKVEINVGSPSAAFQAGDGRAGTGDAYLGYKYGDGMTVLFGTMKAPLLREELVDSRYQLAVERSALNYIYTGGRVDGIALDWMGDQFHITGAFSDGIRTGQTVWATPTTDFAFTGRAEYLVSGTWDQFSDFTSPAGDEQGIMIGGAIHYQESEDDSLVLADVDVLVLTADISAEFGGANLFAAFIYTDIDVASLPTVNPLGFLVQGGVALSDDWEAFARYEFSDFDVTGIEDLSLITFGVTRYFAGHNAKWTTDVGIGLDDVVFAPEITGLRTDVPGEDGQIVIRSQIQLVF
ncbi:MAG: hypothetical protein IIB99_13360 [Planctomycetes bacterium]|nr:hypothetical protein [Planctomycetota bacterium]